MNSLSSTHKQWSNQEVSLGLARMWSFWWFRVKILQNVSKNFRIYTKIFILRIHLFGSLTPFLTFCAFAACFGTCAIRNFRIYREILIHHMLDCWHLRCLCLLIGWWTSRRDSVCAAWVVTIACTQNEVCLCKWVFTISREIYNAHSHTDDVEDDYWPFNQRVCTTLFFAMEKKLTSIE